jgi:hypothetical protein
MNANDVMGKMEHVNKCFIDLRTKTVQERPDTRELTQCGWTELDANGMFFRSPKNSNGYAVDMNTPNCPHVEVSHKYQRLETLDGVPEDDLKYLDGMLEELEVWLA